MNDAKPVQIVLFQGFSDQKFADDLSNRLLWRRVDYCASVDRDDLKNDARRPDLRLEHFAKDTLPNFSHALQFVAEIELSKNFF